MTGSEAKRAMGVGMGTLAQKRETHRDPFEPEVIKPDPEEPKANWWDALVNSGQITIWQP